MCEGSCISKSRQCGLQCPDGFLSCTYSWGGGRFCGSINSYQLCNGDCIAKWRPCDGNCPPGYLNCFNSCESQEQYRECDGECLIKSKPCNGHCPEGFLTCTNSQNQSFCGSEQDYVVCNGVCQQEYLPCCEYDLMLTLSVKDSQEYDPVSGVTGSISLNGGIIARNVSFDASGVMSINVSDVGQYSVTFKAPGFIDKTETFWVSCPGSESSVISQNNFTVVMSPSLQSGDTRVVMSWTSDAVSDLDIYVVAFDKDGSSTSIACTTYYGNDDCEETSTSLDRCVFQNPLKLCG